MASDENTGGLAPSPWVARFAPMVSKGGRVLDLACGSGRHCQLFLELGHPVLALDRDLLRLGDLTDNPALETLEVDLEAGGPFPLTCQTFAAVVVTNYLYRPILPNIVTLVEAGGLLIYDTFALGNERFGRPSNPNYLLKPGELLDVVRGDLRVLAYEDLIVERPAPAAVQRVCAQRPIEHT